MPGQDVTKDKYGPSRMEENLESIVFVVTRVSGTTERFSVARFRHRVDLFRVDITLEGDAAMQLVTRG